MTGGSLLVAACLALHSAVHSVAGVLCGLDRARRGAGRHLVQPGVRRRDAALSARLPPRHHHPDLPRRPGQHRVHPAVGLADPLARAGGRRCGCWRRCTCWCARRCTRCCCAARRRRRRSAAARRGSLARGLPAQRALPADRRVRGRHDGRDRGPAAAHDQPAARQRPGRSLGDRDSGQHRRDPGAGAAAAVLLRASLRPAPGQPADPGADPAGAGGAAGRRRPSRGPRCCSCCSTAWATAC